MFHSVFLFFPEKTPKNASQSIEQSSGEAYENVNENIAAARVQIGVGGTGNK
jgi:hypothetical protein